MRIIQKQIKVYDSGDVLKILSFPTYSSSRKKMVSNAKRILVTDVQIAKNGNPSYWVLLDSAKHIRVSGDDLSECEYITNIDLSALFNETENS